MTREETKKIIALLKTLYPNYKPEDLKLTLNVYYETFKEFEIGYVLNNILEISKVNDSSFAPSIGTIMHKLLNVHDSNRLMRMVKYCVDNLKTIESIKKHVNSMPEELKAVITYKDILDLQDLNIYQKTKVYDSIESMIISKIASEKKERLKNISAIETFERERIE